MHGDTRHLFSSQTRSESCAPYLLLLVKAPKNKCVGVRIVRLLAADGFAEKRSDMNDLSGEVAARKKLLHATPAQEVPIVIIDGADQMIIGFVHLKKTNANGAACYTADLVHGGI